MRVGYALVSRLSRIAFRLCFGLEVYGLENIPRAGKLILASNHRSNYDPPILGGVVPREIHFFAKEELFRGKVFGSFIRYLNAFPVRRGQFDRHSLSVCLGALDAGGCLLMFPEGTRAPDGGFLKAKLGVGWVAALSGAPVLPVYVHGSTVDKLRLHSRPAIRVIFGKPISAAELAADGGRGKELYELISNRILESIRELSLRLPGGIVRDKGEIFDRSIIDNERLR